MNLQHLKYAVEVERTGSITRAANNLYMNQPHLSKAIKELEESIGLNIFSRTSKGMIPTKKGAQFLTYAKKVLAQVEEMENLYRPGNKDRGKFDVSVPRASYISFAFTEFLKTLPPEREIEINYRETNSTSAIKRVYEGENDIGIIRYQTIYEHYFLDTLAEKDLVHKPIWEFEYQVLLSKQHPLAQGESISYHELSRYTELVHGDLTVPSLPLSQINEIKRAENCKKQISVYERGSQFEILMRIPTTYMWVSPMPQEVLDCFGLVTRRCTTARNKHKDLLIYRRGYHLTTEDEQFITEVFRSAERVKPSRP